MKIIIMAIYLLDVVDFDFDFFLRSSMMKYTVSATITIVTIFPTLSFRSLIKFFPKKTAKVRILSIILITLADTGEAIKSRSEPDF